MKKITILAIAGLVAMAFSVSAQTYEPYSGTAAGGSALSVYVRAGAGQPIAQSFNYSVTTAGTVTVYTPKRETTAYAAITGTTNISLVADANGYIEGVAPAVSDYVLFPKYGSSNAVVGTIGTVFLTNGYVNLSITGGTLGNAPINGVVYFGEAEDVMSIYVGTTAGVGNEGAWAGYYRKPVMISVPSGSAPSRISGVTKYQ